MKFSARQLHRTCWLALCAMLVFALAPGFSRMLSAGEKPVSLVELCTAQGVVSVETDATFAGAETNESSDAALFGDHCAFCSLQNHLSADIPSIVTVAVFAPAPEAMPRLYKQIARTPHVWASARPRGPPHAA